MALVEVPFKDRFKNQLLEALRLTRGSLPTDEYKERLETLRESFLETAIGTTNRDHQTWSDDQQQSWGRTLGELRRFAVSGKFSSKGENIGQEILGKLVGFYESQLAEAVAVLTDATGMSVRSFSQRALRPLYEKGLEVLKKGSTSSQSEEDAFLDGLDSGMNLAGACKVIGDWLKGRSENSTSDATALDLKKTKAEKTALSQPAPTRPDPRAELQENLEKAKAQKAQALIDEDPDALKTAKGEILRIEGELAALESQPALVDTRVQLQADLEKAKADKAKALADEDPDALKTAKGEILRIEGELAALESQFPTFWPAPTDRRSELQQQIATLYAEADALRNSGNRKEAREKEDAAEALETELAALPTQATQPTAAHDPLATAIAVCESAPEVSRLRKILAAYRSGGFQEEAEEEGISMEDIFVRRVQGILRKK